MCQDTQSISRPVSQTTAYIYDRLGQLHSVQDGNGHLLTYDYDALGRLPKKTWPSPAPGVISPTEQCFYEDQAGNLTTVQVADGHSNHFSYDALRRVSMATYWDGQIIRYSYTPTGKTDTVTQTVGGVNRISHYTYDAQDRLVGTVGPSNQTLSYDYDLVGNRTGITTPVGIVNYQYNAINQLTDVVSRTNGPGGVGSGPAKTTHYDYDFLNRRTGATLPNGIGMQYTYDYLDRLTDVVQSRNGGATSLYACHYGLDAAGNRTNVTEIEGDPSAPSAKRTLTWNYDDAYRLLSEQSQDNLSSSGLISTTAFTYDYTGNRQSLTFSTNQTGNTSATTRYGYNNLDQLLVVTPTAGGPVINYTYDGRGNLAGMVDNTSGKSTSYNFDALDRLSILTQTVGGGASVVTSNYRYDWGGRRIGQSISGSGVPSASQTAYLWDETSQYGDVVLETDAASGNPQVSYVLGGGELLSQDKVGVTSYYLKDGHGSVRSLSDGSGNLVVGEQYNYDAFGSLVSGPTNPASKYLYTGQQFDGQTGLYDLRARYYNPGNGRFLSQDTDRLNVYDPIELNRYVYTHNNPVGYSDPTGMVGATGTLTQPKRGNFDYSLLITVVAAVASGTVIYVGATSRDLIARLSLDLKFSDLERIYWQTYKLISGATRGFTIVYARAQDKTGDYEDYLTIYISPGFAIFLAAALPFLSMLVPQGHFEWGAFGTYHAEQMMADLLKSQDTQGHILHPQDVQGIVLNNICFEFCVPAAEKSGTGGGVVPGQPFAVRWRLAVDLTLTLRDTRSRMNW